eukprot:516845_1
MRKIGKGKEYWLEICKNQHNIENNQSQLKFSHNKPDPIHWTKPMEMNLSTFEEDKNDDVETEFDFGRLKKKMQLVKATKIYKKIQNSVKYQLIENEL